MQHGNDTTGFAAQAEAHRRAGRPEEAERIAREGLAAHPDFQPGRVALGLALMDLGRLREARRQLEQVVDLAVRPTPSAPPPAPSPVTNPLEDPLDDDEFDRAFDGAEADAEQVIDADRIALEAMRQVDREEAALSMRPDSPFATRTVADLLERQGDPSAARALRAAVAVREADIVARTAPPERSRMRRGAVATLERWLSNLQRSRA